MNGEPIRSRSIVISFGRTIRNPVPIALANAILAPVVFGYEFRRQFPRNQVAYFISGKVIRQEFRIAGGAPDPLDLDNVGSDADKYIVCHYVEYEIRNNTYFLPSFLVFVEQVVLELYAEGVRKLLCNCFAHFLVRIEDEH